MDLMKILEKAAEAVIEVVEKEIEASRQETAVPQSSTAEVLEAARQATTAPQSPIQGVQGASGQVTAVPQSPRISVITPVHAAANQYVQSAYDSLCAQMMGEWSWVVMLNNGGELPDSIRKDARVQVIRSSETNVGSLKRLCCANANAPYVLELDADDVLHPECLGKVLSEFERGADFVYSDFAEFRGNVRGLCDASWGDYPYGAAFGWQNYPVETPFGTRLLAMKAPPATAHTVRSVLWAPNHVRAWRRDVYEKAGGHDAAMPVGDDHDLVVRMFLGGAKFARIPECLYYYRDHPENTVKQKFAAIQEASNRTYNKNVWALAEKFAGDAGLRKVDLCGAHDGPAGYECLDRDEPDDNRPRTLCDLNGKWPLESSSVGVLRATDALEHLRDPVHAMSEAWRVLAPGGFFMVASPSDSIAVDVGGQPVTMAGRGASCDPTHLTRWNKLSFRYYTDKNFAKYVSAFRGRFQLAKLVEWFPSDWHRENCVPYVEAHMFCVKDGFRAMGEFLW